MKHEFIATMQRAEGMDGAYVVIPFDVEQAFGAKRVKVKAWFDGVLYRGSIVRMEGEYLLGLTKAVRAQIGKQPGAQLTVQVEKDEEERSVEVPPELAVALNALPEVAVYFHSLSYSHQREYVLWIDSAKTEATRTARVEKTVAMLSEKRTFREK